MSAPLLLVGASVRAAVHSARRAGYTPLAVDRFTDVDLRSVAGEWRQSLDYPADVESLCESLPPAPWMYTGALENRPDVIECLSRSRPLWGNGADVLRVVRDPFRVAELLDAGNLPVPRCRRGDVRLISHETAHWLTKPIAGGCGAAIEPARAEDERSPGDWFHQEFIAGMPISALFLSDGIRAELCGMSRQLIGMSSQPVTPFAFCGAITGETFSTGVVDVVRRVADALVRGSGLRGLFGCDFVLRDGVPWLVEVNPRYTATVELYERLSSDALLRRHAEAFVRPAGATRERELRAATRVHRQRVALKLILFAHESFNAPDLSHRLDMFRVDGFPRFADLPPPGVTISRGDPICTLLLDGDDFARLACDARAALEELAGDFPAGVFFPAELAEDLSRSFPPDRS